ncbi:MAG: acyl-CoA dehydrogenase family protein [Myxococcota bacterium]
MHFGLNEEQQLLQETVQGFVAGECPPPRLRELFDAGTGHDPGLWKGLAEMGIPGLAIDEAHGGAGMQLLELAIVFEELGAGCLPGPLFGHALAGLAIQLAGSDAQRERWLPGIASGETLATVAFADGADGWDPEQWSLGLDGGSLRGQKQHVPHGGHAEFCVVGVAGGGFAVVETQADGVRCEDENGIDRGRPLATLHFDGAAAEILEGDAGAAARVRDAAAVLLAAEAFGAAWRLVTMTTEYAKTREQFGTPIAQFQGVKHQLADMATQVEASRALYWYAAHAWDELPAESAHAAALAKSHITDRAIEVARASVELHGGLGFTWECDVQLWFKRVLFDRAWGGTPEQHRRRIAELGAW